MKNVVRSSLAAIALIAASITSAFAVGPDVNATTTGLAIRGVDPVSYFTAGEPQEGKVNITAIHNGATYRFTSEANRDAFKANPAKYAPQFGGFCAYGTAKGVKVDGNPELWKIVDDKLYLNLSKEVVKLWNEDVNGYIHEANDNWTKIKDVDPSKL
ncbi:YHS domain-containing (seleno)protein [Roseibium sp.]|uniref:YHS domain-containing (seleno)protein n=1 Tax=Roseibium sp. TaxID=1936156 RepID=UPI003A970284